MEVSLRLKRGSTVGKTNQGKGTKWMVVVDGCGVPPAVRLYSASPDWSSRNPVSHNRFLDPSPPSLQHPQSSERRLVLRVKPDGLI
jgi:hypothetical protein